MSSADVGDERRCAARSLAAASPASFTLSHDAWSRAGIAEPRSRAFSAALVVCSSSAEVAVDGEQRGEVLVDERLGAARLLGVALAHEGPVQLDVDEQLAQRAEVAVAAQLLLGEVDLDVLLVDEEVRRDARAGSMKLRAIAASFIQIRGVSTRLRMAPRYSDRVTAGVTLVREAAAVFQ